MLELHAIGMRASTSTPRDRRGARGRREQAAQHADRRGLARAVGAEDAEDLAGADREADVVHGDDVAKALDQATDLDDAPRRLSPASRPGASWPLIALARRVRG